MEIVSANSKRWVFSESPQVAFAIWTAAFVGVYSINFPWMDTCAYMNSEESNIEFRDGGETVKGATRLAVKTLTEMSSRLKMASGWTKMIKRMDAYFAGIIQDYNRNLPLHQKNHVKPISGERKLSLREGGNGGGLEEYKLLEKELKDFGSIEEEERNSTPTASDITDSRASTSGPIMTPNMKSETMQAMERLPAARSIFEGTWAAVNNNASTGISDPGRPVSYSFNDAPYQSNDATQDAARYHQRQQPRSNGSTSNSPSLMGASQNSVDLNSPYIQSQLGHVPQPDSYSFNPQPILPGYPTSAHNTFRLHQTGGLQDGGFDGHLSGVPAWEWPPDGGTNFYETTTPAAMQNTLYYY